MIEGKHWLCFLNLRLHSVEHWKLHHDICCFSIGLDSFCSPAWHSSGISQQKTQPLEASVCTLHSQAQGFVYLKPLVWWTNFYPSVNSKPDLRVHIHSATSGPTDDLWWLYVSGHLISGNLLLTSPKLRFSWIQFVSWNITTIVYPDDPLTYLCLTQIAYIHKGFITW